ncbi:unnamed protein product [Sordaria macrospora k-hell]|uniref:WGS project CABT00000000 data, contig 2.54 n=1 Tax=Sordaria macrospora (strain ATCC MYA-333 / DSM 997 / K(L3346) / K-hell) TaxID=771870 RepID=F7W9R2_SORMK|nr:uncharacterized protein SMAC_08502 [Sordaria macrospora k-hell]CCC14053.1 unnamed protein product [Sordaria macrospora k-hell]
MTVTTGGPYVNVTPIVKRPKPSNGTGIPSSTPPVSLPLIYYLLNRAAVVYAQRTSKRSKLNVRQLFSLADEKWFKGAWEGPSHGGNRLAEVAVVLIVVAFALPIVRAPLVSIEIQTGQRPLSWYSRSKDEWDQRLSRRLAPWEIGSWEDTTHRSLESRYNLLHSNVVGVDVGRSRIANIPRDSILDRIRDVLVHYHPADNAERNWHDPETGRLFASTVARHTTTGLFRQHAMRLNSTARCTHIEDDEFMAKCPPSARNQDVSLRTFNGTLDICTGQDVEGNPWGNLERDGYFQIKNITEVAYVNMTLSKSYDSDQLILRCTGATTLGYFELGNHYNSGQHGPLVSARSDRPALWTQDGFIRDTQVSGIGGSAHPDYDLTMVTDPGLAMNWSPGPLLLVLHALFGNGSVFHLAQGIATPNNTSSPLGDPQTLSNALCQARSFPFRRINGRMANPCSYYNRDGSDWLWASSKLYDLLTLFSRSLFPWEMLDGVTNIEMAIHLASQTLMEAATYPGSDDDNSDGVDRIWSLLADETTWLQFVVSDKAMIALSVLIALQAVGILVLLWYICRAPTWTTTLDTMAIARITHQIKDDGLIKGLGLRQPTKGEWEYLAGVDALVGLSKGVSVELSTPMNGGRSAGAPAPAPIPSPGLLVPEHQDGHTSTPSIRTSPPNEQSTVPVSPVSPVSATFFTTAPSPEPSQHLQPTLNHSTPSSRRHSFIDADLDADHLHADEDSDDNLPPAYTPRGAPPVIGQAGFPDSLHSQGHMHSAATSRFGILPQHQTSLLPPLIPPPNPFEEVEQINRRAELMRRRAGEHSEEITVQVGGEGLIDRRARKRAKVGLLKTVEGGDEEEATRRTEREERDRVGNRNASGRDTNV